MIPMVIPKGGIFNVCKILGVIQGKIIIQNNIITLEMNFIKEYISETEISDSDEIRISKGTAEVTLKDGSKCQHLCNGNSKERKNTQSKPRKRKESSTIQYCREEYRLTNHFYISPYTAHHSYNEYI